MLCCQISIKNTLPSSVTVCFPVISISSTSLKENSNPKYLNVMINPFSVSPRQKCSSLIPHLQKLIIHNTLLVILWQIVSLAVKESFLIFSLHPSLMSPLLVFTILNASPLLYFPSILPHRTSSFLLFCSEIFWQDPTALCYSEYLTLCIFTLSNIPITTIPSKLSHLVEKMARTSQCNPDNGSRSVISRSVRYQILEKKR